MITKKKKPPRRRLRGGDGGREMKARMRWEARRGLLPLDAESVKALWPNAIPITYIGNVLAPTAVKGDVLWMAPVQPLQGELVHAHCRHLWAPPESPPLCFVGRLVSVGKDPLDHFVVTGAAVENGDDDRPDIFQTISVRPIVAVTAASGRAVDNPGELRKRYTAALAVVQYLSGAPFVKNKKNAERIKAARAVAASLGRVWLAVRRHRRQLEQRRAA